MKRIKNLFFRSSKYLFIVCITSNSTFSQQYHPIPANNVLWKIEHRDSGVFPCGIFELFYYYLNGDTVLNGVHYNKLYRKSEDLTCTNVNYPFYFIGGIRQDTINRKVYCFLNSIGQDSLLYDFNLNINDTLPTSLINGGTPIQIIDRIDSVLIGPQEYRRTFHFSPGNGGFSDSIIEGIGSAFGLLETFDRGIGDYFILKCFKIDSTLMLGSQSDCIFTTLVPYLNSTFNNIEIYPNPCHDKTQLQFDPSFQSTFSKMNVSVKNILGREIMSYSINNLNSNSVTIDMCSVSPGVYLIELQNDFGNYSNKIIKE